MVYYRTRASEQKAPALRNCLTSDNNAPCGCHVVVLTCSVDMVCPHMPIFAEEHKITDFTERYLTSGVCASKHDLTLVCFSTSGAGVFPSSVEHAALPSAHVLCISDIMYY